MISACSRHSYFAALKGLEKAAYAKRVNINLTSEMGEF